MQNPTLPEIANTGRRTRLPRPSSPKSLVRFCVGACAFCVLVPGIALGGQERGQTPDITIVPKTISDTLDSARMRNANKEVPGERNSPEVRDTCLLPPLTLVHSPIVAATALAVPSKAKKEYQRACSALAQRKAESAEEHLRKAVHLYDRYSAAWVTLGQVLAARNQTSESRSACSEASTAEPNYIPAYLCLADLAARDNAWAEVLQLTRRILALDPSSVALAYEYQAAASLRLNKLEEAERSALRAVDIDKDKSDPRVHFVLAQVYEAKGDRAGEIAQLHEYLKSATNPDDIAVVTAYLARLERSNGGETNRQNARATGNSSSTPATQEVLNNENTNFFVAADLASGPNSDESDVKTACKLEDVLPQIERRVQEFLENVQRFTATESLVHESLDASGRVARTEHGSFDYVVSIDEPIAGMLAVNEYQNSRSASGMAQTSVVTRGLPALLLIFHPFYAGDFAMRCDGLTLGKGGPAWQIRFRQREDKPSRIRSYKMGTAGAAYEINLQGRAWFAADSYQIVKLEADLIKAIPEIQLTVDHTSAEYGPVHFRSRGIDIWLPQAADLVSERKGKRLHERIGFSNYLLFAVDNKQEVAPPKPQEWLSGLYTCLPLSGCGQAIPDHWRKSVPSGDAGNH